MFSFFSKKDKDGPRILERASDLQVGDIIIFNDMLVLPESLRGQSVEIVKVNAYEYKTGFEPEFVFNTMTNETYFMSTDDEEGELILTISRRIERNIVEQIFDLDDFSAVLDEGFASLKSLASTPDEYQEWVVNEYHEDTDCERCYFHQEDKRGQTPEQYSDGSTNGEELNYFECLNSNGEYGIAIEVYQSGQTEVGLFKRFGENVIQNLLPKATDA